MKLSDKRKKKLCNVINNCTFPARSKLLKILLKLFFLFEWKGLQFQALRFATGSQGAIKILAI